MAVTINYPKQLPMPQQQGYELQTVSPLLRTRLRSGRARQRRAFTNVPTIVKVNYLMTEGQAQLFEGWFRWTLKDGSEWFNCRIKTNLGLQDYVCRFADIYTGPKMISPKYWRYSAELEIRDRQTIGDDWVEFPDFVVGSDIIDLAVNREWPEA